MIAVYYVTAAHRDDPQVKQGGEPVRHDFAKFFSRAGAEKHGVGRDWRDVKIEEREEHENRQDPAHRALGGRKAAWE